jgi:hypothetical protein
MPPFKSGKNGRRLGVCALWGTQPTEGVSSACISCTHDTINWTRRQVSDGIHSRSSPGNPVGQRINTPEIVRVSKLTDMVSFRDVLFQHSRQHAADTNTRRLTNSFFLDTVSIKVATGD